MPFLNWSNYDYHFIIKELAEGFEKQLTCLGENTKKYITFTVPIEKQAARTDKNSEEVMKNISHRLQIKLNLNMDTMIKNVKLVELNINITKYISSQDNNKFILLLQKGVHTYEYINNWEKFNQLSLLKKDFYSHLNMEDITDADYPHTKKVCKDSEI